jgi:hypothetical protein
MKMTDQIWEALNNPNTPRKILLAALWNLRSAQARTDACASDMLGRYVTQEERLDLAGMAMEVARCRKAVSWAIRMWRDLGPDSYYGAGEYSL